MMTGTPVARMMPAMKLNGVNMERRYSRTVIPIRIVSLSQALRAGRAARRTSVVPLLMVRLAFSGGPPGNPLPPLVDRVEPHQDRRPERQNERNGGQGRLG